MIHIDDFILQVKSYGSPTNLSFLDVDFGGVEKFIMPETDFLSLVMVSEAYRQGLDIVFVDEQKFYEGAFRRIRGEMYDGRGPFEGAWNIEFQLSPVLLHGQQFSLMDYSESMGYGVMLKADNIIMELIRINLEGSGKDDDGGWQDGHFKSVQQICDHINETLTKTPTKVYKRWWYLNLPSGDNIFLGFVYLLIGIGVGFYYVFKTIMLPFSYLKRLFTNKI